MLLTAPESPLLFMGQEWAASTPFLYFTDHHAELGQLVTEGRRAEFRHFTAFSDPLVREQIPDPQASSTFVASRLAWDERQLEPHASMLRLHQALLDLRRRERAFRGPAGFRVAALDEATIAIGRESPPDVFLVLVRLQGAGAVDLGRRPPGAGDGDPHWLAGPWQPILTSEDPTFSPDPSPPDADYTNATPVVRFVRPSAVILRRVGGDPS